MSTPPSESTELNSRWLLALCGLIAFIGGCGVTGLLMMRWNISGADYFSTTIGQRNFGMGAGAFLPIVICLAVVHVLALMLLRARIGQMAMAEIIVRSLFVGVATAIGLAAFDLLLNANIFGPNTPLLPVLVVWGLLPVAGTWVVFGVRKRLA